jgi:hypothetical protein
MGYKIGEICFGSGMESEIFLKRKLCTTYKAVNLGGDSDNGVVWDGVALLIIFENCRRIELFN